MGYPMNVELVGRRAVVVGGGKVALRKVRALLLAGSSVTVLAPALEEELQRLADAGRILWKKMCYEAGGDVFRGAFLVICATDVRAVNRAAAEEAKRAGALVNAPEEPAFSDFTVPAAIHRGKLLLTISTGGLSPALSRALRERMEEEFPEAMGAWLETVAQIREEMKERLKTPRERESFWRQAFGKDMMKLLESGQFAQAEVALKNGIAQFRAES